MTLTRGRPLLPAEGSTSQVSAIVPSALKNRLAEAARYNGHTLGQEIAARLEASFHREQHLEDMRQVMRDVFLERSIDLDAGDGR
jgi:hypothetical protein